MTEDHNDDSPHWIYHELEATLAYMRPSVMKQTRQFRNASCILLMEKNREVSQVMGVIRADIPRELNCVLSKSE